jgi:hypothetical protein
MFKTVTLEVADSTYISFEIYPIAADPNRISQEIDVFSVTLKLYTMSYGEWDETLSVDAVSGLYGAVCEWIEERIDSYLTCLRKTAKATDVVRLNRSFTSKWIEKMVQLAEETHHLEKLSFPQWNEVGRT